jgi:hypothetical protein
MEENMAAGYTTKEFIRKAREVHGKRYRYSKLQYEGTNVKATITCRKHGDFKQTPNSHLNSNGCPVCGGTQQRTLEEFVRRAQAIHGKRYDYSKTKYVRALDNVIIVCRVHGEFNQTPHSHINAESGCPKCGFDSMKKLQRSTCSEFVKAARRIHGTVYDYNQFVYTNNRTKSLIICLKHGEFEQSPDNHLAGKGCPICKESCGEKKVARILESLRVPFSRQFKIPECRSKRVLPFDFDVWLCGKPYLIEYHGVQHYRPSLLFGPRQFMQQKKHDSIKKEFCKKNGIPLLIIPHWKRNIEDLIRGFLNKSL